GVSLDVRGESQTLGRHAEGGTPHACGRGARSGMAIQKRAGDARMNAEARSSPYLAPKLPLKQLEAILSDLTAVLGKLPPTPRVRDLCARAEQSRVAIVACRRDGFSGPLRRALTAK